MSVVSIWASSRQPAILTARAGASGAPNAPFFNFAIRFSMMIDPGVKRGARHR
jgi:hypothetical protein